MKLIRYKDPESNISLRVEIIGADLWKYSYNSDKTFVNSNVIGQPPMHDLGKAANLEGDVNIWTIFLGNHNDEDKLVQVTIIWFENGFEIDRWIPREADSEGKLKVGANSGEEISDSCYFKQL